MRTGIARSFVAPLVVLACCCPWAVTASAADDATLMIYRPKRFTGGASSSSYRIDGQSLGGFKHGVFEVKVDPGLHEIRNFYPASREEKFDKIGSEMKYGSHTVEVELLPGQTKWVHQRSNGALEVVDHSALQVDGKLGQTPRRSPRVTRVEGTFVTSGEQVAWDRCAEGIARDCRDYLERYPYGAFVSDAESTLAAVAPKPPPVETSAARERRLPVGIQRDKYMLSLTSALKEERYADALGYFSKLEELDVDLSPSFWFYYGEALFNTGDYEASIDKLYTYIARVGSDGEHYHRALELSTEAEER